MLDLKCRECGQSFKTPAELEEHTDRLHLTEKFSRPDARTLKYDVMIDDPGAYTAPWTSA